MPSDPRSVPYHTSTAVSSPGVVQCSRLITPEHGKEQSCGREEFDMLLLTNEAVERFREATLVVRMQAAVTSSLLFEMGLAARR